jgi:hypothetical protein
LKVYQPANDFKDDDTFEVTAANTPPTVSANNASVTVNEGATATNTGTWSDANSGDTVTLSASVGTVTKSGTNSNGTWSWSYATTDGPAQSQTVTITANDAKGGITTTTFSLTVNNVAPTAALSAPASVNEGSSINLSLTGVTDPSSVDTAAGFQYAFDCGTGSGYGAFNGSNSASCPTDDNGTRTVKGKVKDKDGGFSEYSATVTVNNLPPLVTNFTGPLGPLPVGSTVTMTANFSDPGTADTHTCTFLWDDGSSSSGAISETNGSGSCTGNHVYLVAGVNTVQVTVTDDDSGSATAIFEFVVIFDPSAGFVTGGGWIMSPQGAYAPAPALTGKATFGFISKYQKGATVPTGNTEFQFHVANFNFKSVVYEWLVVAGAKAQYKGEGTVNGVPGFGFLLTATDGQLPGGGGADKFRIKIVNKTTGDLVYDNVPGAGDDIDAANPQVIAGGSIVIHSK